MQFSGIREGFLVIPRVVFLAWPGNGLLIRKRYPMAKTKKPKEAIAHSDDLISLVVAEGQALIAEGKTKAEAAMAISPSPRPSYNATWTARLGSRLPRSITERRWS